MSRRSSRRSLHFACMILIVLLYVVSVPWYRESGAPLRIWLGLPDWVAVALLCYVAVAILNAIAWSVSDVSDTLGGSEDPRAPAPIDPSSTVRESGAVRFSRNQAQPRPSPLLDRQATDAWSEKTAETRASHSRKPRRAALSVPARKKKGLSSKQAPGAAP